MPPRIIRNSDRLRASDRTMITTQTSISLAKSLRLDWHCRHRQRKPREGQTVQSKTPWANRGGTRTDSGLDIETNHSVSGRGRSFCLTSLFIELIDQVLSPSNRKNVEEATLSTLDACVDRTGLPFSGHSPLGLISGGDPGPAPKTSNEVISTQQCRLVLTVGQS